MEDTKWKQIPVRPGQKPICDLCQTEVDIQLSKCLDCDLFICDRCIQIHKRTPSTKNHEIIKRVERELKKSSKISRMCSFHPNEEVIFYCSMCKVLICCECITGPHQTHSCIKIKAYATQKRQGLNTCLHKTKDVSIAQIKTKLQEIDTQSILNDENRSKDLQNLTKKIQHIESVLNKIKNEIVTEYDNVHQSNKDKLQTVKAKLTEQLSETERIYNDYNKILHTGSDLEVIQAEQEISEILESKNSTDIDTEDTELQQPSVIEGKTDDKIQNTLYKYLQLDKDLDSESNEADTETDDDDNQSKCVYSICPLPDNTAFIHYEDLYDNDIVSIDGKVQQTIKFNFEVVDFIMTSQGDVMATAAGWKSTIYKLTKEGVITDTITTAPLLSIHLCETKDGNLLVSLVDKWSYNIEESSRRCVSRITMEGKVLKSYEYNKGSRLFICPRGVSENTNGDMCVVNSTSVTTGQLIILDSSGQLKYIYNGQQLEGEFCPIYIKCDRVGNILVNDFNNQRVHMLNSQYQFVRYVITEDKMSDSPFSLAIDNKTGILWIGGNKGSIYTLKYLK